MSAPDSAEQQLADWLSDLAPAQAAAVNGLCARFPLVKTILQGLAEASPYLFDLTRADAARLIRLLECEPERHLAAPDRKDQPRGVGRGRRSRRDASAPAHESEAALLFALADIGGVWPVMQVTAALTDLAVASVQTACALCCGRRPHAGGCRRPPSRRPRTIAGWSCSHGQDGRGRTELFQRHRPDRVFRSAAPTLAADIEPAPFFVRVTQAMTRLLQQRTGDGYVFRVDLRLPGSSSTQVAISTDSALHYYEREGRTWERGHDQARPCPATPGLAKPCSEIAPFVWRKHLDFAALADVHDMKRQMQTYRGQREIAVEGHNVKVGRGGIREWSSSRKPSN